MSVRSNLWNFKLLFVLLAANFVVLDLAPSIGASELMVDVLFNTARIGIFVYAGWALSSMIGARFRFAFVLGLFFFFF